MVDPFNQKKGILLFIVMATIMIVAILGNVMINIMLSQGRLTTHQVSRIQAYYAAMAGINFAYENLRSGFWTTPAAMACTETSYPLQDLEFPLSISNRTVTIGVAGIDAICAPATQACSPPAGTAACIYAQVDYVYTP